ncbi:MAG: 30S ribosomal protein S9 [Chitinophagales bacterium]|nr:30S ribosomal protein S9 [Chitinophagales bacterium]
MEKTNAIGRRKEASARVIIFPASGKSKIVVNGKDYTDYFPQRIFQQVLEQPFNLLEIQDKYDVIVNVNGGGVKGQAEAIRLGIARSLIKVNPEYRPILKTKQMLTRDPRSVERKKPGRKKARKRFQFSKR